MVENGWYEWRPNDNCQIVWLDVHQIVQVIEDKVWATFVAEEIYTDVALRNGTFVRKIPFVEDKS